MKLSIKVAVCSAIALMGGMANAANVNTLSSAPTGSSLVLLLKNSTDTTYYFAELNKTVGDLRTKAQLQSDTPEAYAVTGTDYAPGTLNESTLSSLNGYTNSNLQGYLSGNTGDNITWTIMGSISGPNQQNGNAAFAVTSQKNFFDEAIWGNKEAYDAANFFGGAFLADEINNGVFTNGSGTANGWGSATVNGVNAPVSFNGFGFENGASLGAAQTMYLLGTTGMDYANVYKSLGTLTLNSAGVMSYSAASPVPVPGAVWLLGSGLMGLVGIGRRRKATAVAA